MDEKLNIGITCYPVAGGSGIVATELGIKLAERGHNVHFIAYDLPFRFGEFRPNMYFHEVDTTSYQLFKFPPYTLTLAAKMAEISCEYDLNLLHVHYAIPHATAAFLARQLIQGRCSPKIITTLHGTDITLVGADESYFDITRFSIESSDGITAVSKYLADETVAEFKIKKHIEVIPNFIDTSRFKPDTSCCERDRFAAPEEKLLCHISNFRPVKRAMDVIDIFERVRKKMPARLLLIGEGPDTMLVRRAIKKNGLEKNVTFLGSQSRVEEILPLADLFLVPSEEESFGLAALEALACGVPVIGSSGTGLVEVVDHGVDGFLHPVGDTKSMARVALSLLGDEEKLRQFKRSANQKAHERFSADKVVDHYERYYRQIILEESNET
jgi:N-acetyl-alpha-D-glucosaminyl L-malate synthase BshA